MSDGSHHRSLARLLAWRADRQPTDLAFTFLNEGETPSDTLTWSGLDARARVIARALGEHVRAADRVLLAYPSGLEFVAGFFGCLYASAIAVPVPAPRFAKESSARARFEAILRDAEPAAVLTHSRVSGLLERMPPARCGVPPTLATDDLAHRDRGTIELPRASADTIAFLQYTSGSTAEPRGVMVSHGNVLHNLHAARARATPGEVRASVSWLPFTHDMGLIEGMLQPVFRGHPAVILPATAFLQRPVRWLRAVSTYRAARSGAPNFAYDLCVRRVPSDEIAALDLSCWRDAYNGAEPVRRETMAAFARRFAPAGFPADAFRPSYGLAEATLLVTCDRWSDRPRVSGQTVSCGRPINDTTVLVVDPATRRPCRAGDPGELWISGPGVARGYWHQPEATEDTFGARTAEGAGPFLRTGDLGVEHDGRLHVTGRLKDVLIVRGQKHAPADLEATAAAASPLLVPGGVAAFSAGADVDGDCIVVAAEISRAHLADPATTEQITATVRTAITEQHGLRIDAVVLLLPGALPRTTSGKIQRYRCWQRWVGGAWIVDGLERVERASAGRTTGLRHVDIAECAP